MGWENRDYARDNHSSGGYYASGSGWSSVCKYIIYANIAVFLLQIFFVRRMTFEEFLSRRLNPTEVQQAFDELELEGGRKFSELSDGEKDAIFKRVVGRGLPMISPVQQALEIDSRKILRGQVWRLVTGAFCHDRVNVWHLIFNMLFLYWFGMALERMYGGREFAHFYFAAILASSVAYVALDLWLQDFVPAIGASGGVMGVTMLYAIHFPRHTILLFFIIPLEVRWLVVIYVAYDLYPVLVALSGAPVDTGVAHAGHLGGLAFGYLYWRYGFRLSPWTEPISQYFTARQRRAGRTRRPSARDVIQMYRPRGPANEQPDDAPTGNDQDEFDREVDEILRKMQEQGMESLSDKEQEILRRASQWYRDRDHR